MAIDFGVHSYKQLEANAPASYAICWGSLVASKISQVGISLRRGLLGTSNLLIEIFGRGLINQLQKC